MSLLYLDASALVKLIRREPETVALREFVANEDLVSCELVLTEVPRAIRRLAGGDARRSRKLITAAEGVLGSVGLAPVHTELLKAAGALSGQGLRALDAIHIAAAATLSPLDGFVSYDKRQRTVAAKAGFAVVSPGVS